MKKKNKESGKKDLSINFVMKYAGLGLLVACFFYFSQEGLNCKFSSLVIVAVVLMVGSYVWKLKEEN